MLKQYVELIEKYKILYKDEQVAFAGHNGPYHQKETYVRNTAHWIITFSYMYQLTKNEEYKKIVTRFTKSLVDDITFSHNGVVRCFESGECSSVNGLIGFAWVIEGLVSAYTILTDSTVLDAAERLFTSQPYNQRLHTWQIVDVEGNNLGTDIAFNHSLWFCYAGAKLYQYRKNETINQQVKDYLENIDRHLLTYRSGLISHFDIHGDHWLRNMKHRMKKQICSFTATGIPWRKDNFVEYERAYHLFSVYAFSWLYLFYPEMDFFKSRKFKKIVSYGLEISNFVVFPNKNIYAYGYNSPAYEFPMVEYVFGRGQDIEEEIKSAELHLKYNVDAKTGTYNANVPDSEVLNARIYELVQYYWLKERLNNEKK